MTLKLSLDGGLSWPEAYHLLLDEGSSAGYPSLTMIDKHTIGIFYEGSQAHLTFQRVNVDDLLARPYSAD
jgi:sialidase-1